jgi:CheY-like chemotaxis protein
MSTPRILLVDDQRQVSRMLRSSLELSGQDYIIVDLPSGEEALLELARGPVDLIVADLKLPGISGLDLVERARELNPFARSILITGHPTPEARARAEALGVVAFMSKPIRTSYFLEAVRRALASSAGTAAPEKVYDYDKQRLLEMLTGMQRELGCEGILLLDDQGRILARSHKESDLALDAALPALMTAFRAGLKISGFLEALLPMNFQYFDGETHDIYLTNVGSNYGLLILFSKSQESGKMGTVVHYTRRAVNDLLDCLSEMGVSEPAKLAKMEESQETRVEPEITEHEDLQLEDVAKSGQDLDADRFWADAIDVSSTHPRAEGEALTYEQARQLGILPEDSRDEEDQGE